MTLLAAFDLDGTVFHEFPWLDYDNAQDLRRWSVPVHSTVQRIKTLKRDGWSLAFVTGRAVNTREATLHGIRRVLGRIDPASVFCQQRFLGLDALIEHKKASLSLLDPLFYVGNMEHDQEAAEAVGIPYMDVRCFQAGKPLPLTMEQEDVIYV